jgi:hypothetical protein
MMIIHIPDDRHHNAEAHSYILSAGIKTRGYMRLTTFFCFWLVSAMAVSEVVAQNDIYTWQRTRFSLGISAGQLTDNSWLGLEVSSPVRHRHFSLRLTGSVHWLEAYKTQRDRWGTFSILNPAVVIYTRVMDRSRWYIDLGPLFIIPQNKVSDKKLVSGISALAGIEVFILRTPNRGVGYHFNIGLNYANAYADRLDSDPRYSNGFIFCNGFRFYF